jgi:hypothetical protein
MLWNDVTWKVSVFWGVTSLGPVDVCRRFSTDTMYLFILWFILLRFQYPEVDCIAADGKMSGELERICKEAVVTN